MRYQLQALMILSILLILNCTFAYSANLNKITINPDAKSIISEAGKQIIIKGTAEKENGEKLNGYVDVIIKGADLKFSGRVKNSLFSIEFLFPENARAGNYSAEITAYEKISGEITNYGKGEIVISIKQIPTRISIITQSQAFPEGNISFKVLLLDQTNRIIKNVPIPIVIYNSNDKIVSETEAESGKEIFFPIKEKSPSGYWKISATYGDLEEKKLFYVKELENINFIIDGNMLTITNVGNALYEKPVSIKIGKTESIVNITLNTGESIKLKLNAPDGEYDIRVSDKKTEKHATNFLTGNSIGINEISKFEKSNVAIKILSAIIIIAVFFIMIKVILKKRRILK